MSDRLEQGNVPDSAAHTPGLSRTEGSTALTGNDTGLILRRDRDRRERE